MTDLTYAGILRPSVKGHAFVYDCALVLGGSLFIALCAQLSFRLPFSPVPITAQTLAVLLVGALSGARRGALSVVTYLSQGIVGLPVFAGGMSGLAYLLGPTGGYLVGFVVAAYVTGGLAERGWDRRVGTAFQAMLLGNVVLYAFGLAWLTVFVGVKAALPLGLYPFIPGDLVKLAIATTVLPSGWALLRKP
jgi:biotin transport system substrate-specific component